MPLPKLALENPLKTLCFIIVVIAVVVDEEFARYTPLLTLLLPAKKLSSIVIELVPELVAAEKLMKAVPGVPIAVAAANLQRLTEIVPAGFAVNTTPPSTAAVLAKLTPSIAKVPELAGIVIVAPLNAASFAAILAAAYKFGLTFA